MEPLDQALSEPPNRIHSALVLVHYVLLVDYNETIIECCDLCLLAYRSEPCNEYKPFGGHDDDNSHDDSISVMLVIR